MMQLKLFVCSLFAINTTLAVPLHNHVNHASPLVAENPIQKYQTLGKEIVDQVFAQVGEEDKSLSAQLFKYFNIAMDAIYGFGCRYTGCLEPTPQELSTMARLMNHHKEDAKYNLAVIA